MSDRALSLRLWRSLHQSKYRSLRDFHRSSGIGLGYETLRGYFAGEGMPPPLDRLERIAELLEVDADWVVYGRTS